MKAAIKLVTFFSILLVIACGTEGKKVETKGAVAPKTTTTAKAKATTYRVNKGTLNWTGSKLGGNHQGTISVALGDIKAKGDNITGGQFTIDMSSITNTDQEAGNGKEKLEGHLKSADFFDVATFPTATFVITGVSSSKGNADVTHEITGNLTIRGVSKSITIPVNVAVVGNKLTVVSPAFKIDRTQWGVKYHSSSIVGIAKDKIIDNDIALVLNIEATSNATLQ